MAGVLGEPTKPRRPAEAILMKSWKNINEKEETAVRDRLQIKQTNAYSNINR